MPEWQIRAIHLALGLIHGVGGSIQPEELGNNSTVSRIMLITLPELA